MRQERFLVLDRKKVLGVLRTKGIVPPSTKHGTKNFGGGGGTKVLHTNTGRCYPPPPPGVEHSLSCVRPWVRRSIYKKKVLQDPGPNTQTAATIHKEVLTPPKKGYPGAGGNGGHNPKNHWGIIFGPKMMILQKVTNDPKKGGAYNTRACA